MEQLILFCFLQAAEKLSNSQIKHKISKSAEASFSH
jgi:hypothetical protein